LRFETVVAAGGRFCRKKPNNPPTLWSRRQEIGESGELAMARPDFPDFDPPSEQSRLLPSANEPIAASPIVDRVPWDSPGAREIGFDIPERYNASEVLFQNLAAGRGELVAVTGPAGQRSYAQLAADAARWGNAFLSLGLSRGERVLLLLDDTPIYPAAFFGAVRAGLVPLLINVLTPPDLLRFYLADSSATVVVAEAEFCEQFEAACGQDSGLKTLIVVNGARYPKISGAETKQAQSWLASFSDRLACADMHRNDMAFWMYSSGSTGRPKGIVHLQHDMAYTHQSYARSVLKLAPGELCFSVPKIFFSYGFGNSITFPFSAGASSLLMPGGGRRQRFSK
jgi:acyl-coenzyme A synthetase/AMP-(fatty) acid ligase